MRARRLSLRPFSLFFPNPSRGLFVRLRSVRSVSSQPMQIERNFLR